MLVGKYKQFPPLLGHIKIPVSSKQAALTAAALYAPSRRVTRLLHKASRLYLRLLGPRALPGATHNWTPPMSNESWAKLLSQIQQTVGFFDDTAVIERRQMARRGFAVLLLSGDHPVAFVRIQQDRHERFRREYEALGLVHSCQPRVFRAAEPLGLGCTHNWSFLATTAVLPGVHRVPKDPPIRKIVDAIKEALANLPRPPHIPLHWSPMHGDFTPWNLRDPGDSPLILYDWEHVGWGPPGADEILYRATEAVLRKKRYSPEWPEAAAYWYDRLSNSTSKTRAERQFTSELRAVLKPVM